MVASAPTGLLTDGVSNPTNITHLTPNLSAVHNDAGTNPATHYELQVNTASDFTGTVMWNTGKTALSADLPSGARSQDFIYAGTTLSENGTTYYWRIRFWNDKGFVFTELNFVLDVIIVLIDAGDGEGGGQ